MPKTTKPSRNRNDHAYARPIITTPPPITTTTAPIITTPAPIITTSFIEVRIGDDVGVFSG